MCVCVCVFECVCVKMCVCVCSLFVLTFLNIFLTISSRHLTPSCLLSLLLPTPTLPLGRRRRPRGNVFGDAGAAALAGSVVNLIALRELNLG